MIGKPLPPHWHIVRIPASKVWTLTEAQTIPPLAVAKLGDIPQAMPSWKPRRFEPGMV
jgi:hypothetical protein